MMNIGTGEMILIAVAALLILGPKRLPELARGVGKFIKEFRRQTDDVRNVVEREFYKMDLDMNEAPLAKLQSPSEVIPYEGPSQVTAGLTAGTTEPVPMDHSDPNHPDYDHPPVATAPPAAEPGAPAPDGAAPPVTAGVPVEPVSVVPTAVAPVTVATPTVAPAAAPDVKDKVG